MGVPSVRVTMPPKDSPVKPLFSVPVVWGRARTAAGCMGSPLPVRPRVADAIFAVPAHEERGPVMEDSAPPASITAAAAFLLLLSLSGAGPMRTVAQEAKCPFDGRRPPLGEILKGPASQRPSLCKANLAGTNLAGADLSDANLKGSNLARANLKRSRLVGAELAGSHLGKANLNGTSLAGADLGGTNLAEADLAGADLTNVDLAGAALTGANLTGAKLNNANLESAKLNNANLNDANVTEAYLGSARLEGANLISVKGITCDQLRAAKTDRATKLPGGMKCS